MNTTYMKEYWKGYRAMKRKAYDYYNVRTAFLEIYNSNHGNAYVAGACKAKEYIERIGLQNLKI